MKPPVFGYGQDLWGQEWKDPLVVVVARRHVSGLVIMVCYLADYQACMGTWLPGPLGALGKAVTAMGMQ